MSLDTHGTPDPAMNGIDAERFRSVLRSAAAGVVVITTHVDGEAHGMTATAFSSVSAKPPTVLVVVNRSARTHPKLLRSGRFVVNFLAEDQDWIGRRFAAKLDDQFDGVGYEPSNAGLPVFKGNAAYLECVTQNKMEVGTHTIFIGLVVGGDTNQSAPLLYHDGRFKALARMPPQTAG